MMTGEIEIWQHMNYLPPHLHFHTAPVFSPFHKSLNPYIPKSLYLEIPKLPIPKFQIFKFPTSHPLNLQFLLHLQSIKSF